MPELPGQTHITARAPAPRAIHNAGPPVAIGVIVAAIIVLGFLVFLLYISAILLVTNQDFNVAVAPDMVDAQAKINGTLLYVRFAGTVSMLAFVLGYGVTGAVLRSRILVELGGIALSFVLGLGLGVGQPTVMTILPGQPARARRRSGGPAHDPGQRHARCLRGRQGQPARPLPHRQGRADAGGLRQGLAVQ